MSSGLSACSRLSICSPLSTSSRVSALSEGLLVTLTLDPLAMLAPFNNAKLNARCLELENKRYLAVIGLKPLGTGVNSQTFEFHLVSQGLAKIMPGLGVNSAMCVPILPETDHPTREGLQTTCFPLPLPNCYYHSHNSTVLLDVSHVDDSTFWEVRISSDDLERLDQIGVDDAAQSAAVRRTLKPRPEAKSLSQRPLMPFHDTVLPLPILRPGTQKTSTPPSASDMYIPEGFTVPQTVLGRSPPQSTTPCSTWASTLTTSAFQFPTNENNENRDDRNNWHFRPKVKVSLDLKALEVTLLPSSTDFLEEIRRVHDLLLESFQCGSSAFCDHPSPAAPHMELRIPLPRTRRRACSRFLLNDSHNKLRKKKVAASPIHRKVSPSGFGSLSTVRQRLQNAGGMVCKVTHAPLKSGRLLPRKSQVG